MDELKRKIAQKLKQIEELIKKDEDKSKIELERKELDKLLKKYLKDIQK